MSYASESREKRKITVDFRINDWQIDSTFSDNAQSLHTLRSLLDEVRINPDLSVDSLSVSGYASPDGSLNKNKELSLRRAVALYHYLTADCGVADSLISFGENIVAWGMFREMVAASRYSWTDDALRIMSIGDDEDPVDNNRRINRLKALADGLPWRIIREDFLPRLRSALVVTAVISNQSNQKQVMPQDNLTDAKEGTDSITQDYSCAEYSACTSNKKTIAAIYTNLLFDALAIPNLGVDVFVHSKWSVGVSAAYSGWNYFRSDLKFRTLSISPEVRFWPRRQSGATGGFFLDIHGGCHWYNVAFGGDSRYQDHAGHAPALGGGLGLGCRLPVGSSPWIFEFAIGAGAYRLDYDVFSNQPDGILKDRVKKCYIGPDRIAVSVGYTFQSKRKGGGL